MYSFHFQRCQVLHLFEEQKKESRTKTLIFFRWNIHKEFTSSIRIASLNSKESTKNWDTFKIPTKTRKAEPRTYWQCHDFIFIIYNDLIYKGPCTILVTPNESQVRKSLKAHKASKEVLWSPLLANQWAGKRASSGHLTNSRLAFNCFSQLLIWLDSVVKASMYLKFKDLKLYFNRILNF